MIERIQRTLLLTLALAAAGWGIFAWSAGWRVAAVTGVLGLLGLHAFVIAIEFAWMIRVSRGDSTPAPNLWRVARAWWREVMAATLAFGWRQPFWSRRWPDHLPQHAAAETGIVLVHGYFCNRGLWNPWLKRLRECGVPHVAVTLPSPFAPIETHVDTVEQAVRRIERATGRPPVLVGHSMGGLVLRCWDVERNGASRVARIITIGSPHHGTPTATLGHGACASQMRVESAWLKQLSNRESGRHDHFTCFYGHCDNMVFPASTATLSQARNVHLPDVGHVEMAMHPLVWSEMMGLVERS